MSTTVRPEVSKKSDYYISKERYYELKHFVKQYPEWERWVMEHMCTLASIASFEESLLTANISDPTGDLVAKRDLYFRKMDVINRCAIKAVERDWAADLIRNVVNDISYEKSKFTELMSDYEYRKCYRRFFWLLDKERG